MTKCCASGTDVNYCVWTLLMLFVHPRPAGKGCQCGANERRNLNQYIQVYTRVCMNIYPLWFIVNYSQWNTTV